MPKLQSNRTQDPEYDVTKASQTYSNIAAVLAGFALAAVILISQNQDVPQGADATYVAALRDRATIAFLVALFGCIASAFTFGVVTGEATSGTGTHATALFGGAGFALSTAFVFWGLAYLTKIYLSESIVQLTRWLFFGTICIIPLYLIFYLIDAIRLSEKIPFSGGLFLRLAWPNYVPIIPAIIISAIRIPALANLWQSAFIPVAVASFFIILISAGGALFISERPVNSPLSATFIGGCKVWVLVQSVILAMLALLTR